MSRCQPHRVIEPCWYCKNGVQPFESTMHYLDAMEDRLGFLARHEQTPSSAPSNEETKFDVTQAIGVIRDYALGDIVMLSAALRSLKKQNPDRPLALVTRPELFDILDGAYYLDAQLPKHSYENANFFKTYDLCGAVETEAGGRLSVKDYLTKARPDIFAELVEVEGGAEHFPITVNSQALEKMRTVLQGCQPPFIGLAPTCGSPVRAMPPEFVEPLSQNILAEYGGTLIIMGKTREWNRHLAALKVSGAINLIDNLSVAELIALCSLMHAMVSPDTGTMHVAGALGVKCLCLMGNNNPKNFSDFYSSVQTMQSALPCVPCNDRSIPCAPLPKGQIGADCMRAMSPDKIMPVFKQFYNGKNIAYLHDTPLDFIGGAEITTKGMIKAGLKAGYNVRLFDRNTSPEQLYSLYGYDLIILSNIWRFSKESMAIIMQAIRNKPYVKYEHDHDGLGEAPQGYPRADYAEKIYGGATLNIFVSPAHQKDYAALGDGICIPELIDVEMFKPQEVLRKPGSTLIPVPGKWEQGAVASYTKKHRNVGVLDHKVPHIQMPDLYSQFEKIAHFPQRKWPCDRVIFEAALCGCKVEAGEIVEALSWQKDLSDTEGLRAWLAQVPQEFWGKVGEIIE